MCNVICFKEFVLEVNINGIIIRVFIDLGLVSNFIGMEGYEEFKV